jgi:threonine/homoserine/homoserine lactone efflux protein
MLAILGHALARGRAATAPVVLGNALGAVLLMGASLGGLSALLAVVPQSLTALRWGGAAWLGWLGLRALRDPGPTVAAESAAPREAPVRGLLRGLLIAFSNPKALLFYAAIVPQFLDATRPVLPQFVAFAATFALLEIAATGSVTLAAHALRPVLQRGRVLRAVQRGGGAILIGAGAAVALTPVSP